MDLLTLLLKTMTSNSSVNSMKKKSGATASQIKFLIALALPLIIKYLRKNASSQQGASSLLGALGQHNNTNTISQQIAHADTNDGNAILGHIFGNDYGTVTSNLSQQSGMSASQVQSVLSSLAPSLMSGLSAATNTASQQQAAGKVDLSDGVDLSDLMAIFGTASQKPQAQKPQQTQQAAGLGGMLDALLGGGTTQQKPKKPQQAQSAASGMDDVSALLNLLLSARK
ncbi:MAG: DUF937 domain-containing protein [Firmicutes bacterium]|nr:DUF937 domain-containing protein [Bacillota bacterium]